MANVSTWSSSAASNNAATPDGWPEGMPPSTVNNCGRELMAALRRWYEAAQWIDLGHTPTRVDDDTLRISSDVTTDYHAGRRVRFTGSATTYATILSSSYSAPNTTIEVVMDSGALPNPLSTVAISLASSANHAMPNPSITTIAQLTASQNDWNPGFSGAEFARISSNSSVSVTGLAGGTPGRKIYFTNVGSNDISFPEENAGSVAANRFVFGGVGTTVTITADATIGFWYDSVSSRWRLLFT